ncbi:MAG: hypothetical protein A2X87_02960 [Deltaproteobacteria bacterium GWC2_42_51]|nr:MAG: hypothetical protein A2X87_02960 [Deltaproteobacteria bacterium GWC2_42_51]OGP39318.1 MAG: hypothetical protein A2090_11170 [Deltaproteobacteria bacterium GWD2_42_10]OGP48485.1 MAG: hypothetical protein A2022_01905 [Deltaproteobacteria bacterium GWF2_42_12]OGQ23999.1 MAG: hypothetical protein A3D29_05800 [Deltaproteobacteria bacterium RIFCSPHIGHO2_02_FULL_42_44]OGQ35967.1 MAG: hypothetical protein A3H47_00620 [Deltaproteobacteria bacterium RIFCSPLOWO2_02_FULL_42_39]OGQ65812.1 MAG: hypo
MGAYFFIRYHCLSQKVDYKAFAKSSLCVINTIIRKTGYGPEAMGYRKTNHPLPIASRLYLL